MSERLTGLRILIVEDKFLIAQELVDVLEEAGASIVGPVASSPNGIELTESGLVDVGLLDIDLATGLVFDLARFLDLRQIPVVYVTGYGKGSMPLPFEPAGYIEKPFPPAKLISMLTAFVPDGDAHLTGENGVYAGKA